MAIPSANRYLALRPVVLGSAKLFLLASTQIPLISAAPTLVSRNGNGNQHHVLGGHEFDPKPADDPKFWLYLGVAAALVLSGGAFAGLTIALMGQVCLLVIAPDRGLEAVGRWS